MIVKFQLQGEITFAPGTQSSFLKEQTDAINHIISKVNQVVEHIEIMNVESEIPTLTVTRNGIEGDD